MRTFIFESGKPIRRQSRQLVCRTWQVVSLDETRRGQNDGESDDVLNGSICDKLKTLTGTGGTTTKRWFRTAKEASSVRQLRRGDERKRPFHRPNISSGVFEKIFFIRSQPYGIFNSVSQFQTEAVVRNDYVEQTKQIKKIGFKNRRRDKITQSPHEVSANLDDAPVVSSIPESSEKINARFLAYSFGPDMVEYERGD